MISSVIVAHVIAIVFGLLTILLFVYEKSELRKNCELWLSKTVFREEASEPSVSAVRLHQVGLNFAFVFCFGIAAMFTIALIQQVYLGN